MHSSEVSILNRREMARSALLGSASFLLGRQASSQAIASSKGQTLIINVRNFGAAGDGKTDDTKAIQRALDAAGEIRGAVFVPPGVYLVADLRMRQNSALVGNPTWDYHGSAGTVLRLATGDAKCLLNITEAMGATIEGLAFDGAGLGKGVPGILLDKSNKGKHEDAFRIERCQIAHFTGDGVDLVHAWCFCIRHSMLAFNLGSGLSYLGHDAFLSDNWFSGNRRAGFAVLDGSGAVTFTGNRVEWNRQENILITGGHGFQITGNYLDRAGTCGIALRNGSSRFVQMTLTGNYFKRSGKWANPTGYDSSHLFIEGAEGVSCVGNNFFASRDDGPTGAWSPAYGIVCKNMENCVIANNVLHRGALQQLIVDLGGHGEGVVIKDNPGSLFKES